MKKYTIIFRKLALRDLAAIKEHLDSFSEKAYSKFIDKLEKQIDHLEDMPLMYEEYRANSKYRRMVIDNYVGFYTVNQKTKEIRFYRILHGAQNQSSYLKQPKE